jgi:hypothetical protein
MRAIVTLSALAACVSVEPPRNEPTADDSAPPVVDSEETPTDDSSSPPPPPMTLRIAEVSSNPVAGDTDWIEIWNHGADVVELAGWSIHDRGGASVALSGTLDAGARAHLDAEALGFTIDKDGSSLTLRREGAVVQAFAFGPLLEGMSLAWTDAGWGLDRAPTPGTETTTAFRGDASATGLCGPQLAVDPVQPQEGETVTLELACLGGAADGRGALIVGAAGEPTLDSTASFAPSLSDAGHHAFLAATWTSDPETPPETTLADVNVADAWADPKNVLVDPVAYTDEWGLPVIHLFPKGPLGADYVPATATFQGHTYTMTAKYRGAASYSYPQKSFTLEFEEKDSIDLGDWDMGHRDHLVLITTFDDNSYVRQKLVYDLWAGLAEDARADRMVPRTFFTVLYVDGVYFGLYTAIDHIDDEFARDMGLGGDGNMYKAVDHNGNFYRESVYGGEKATLHDGYEKKEGLPEDDFSDLDALVAFSADSDDDTFRAQAPEWIRVDEFVDWFFLVLYTSAYDSGGKNSYLYDDAPSTDIEFRFTPWDMNDSLGQDWLTYRADASASTSYWMAINGIFRHLLTHPDSAAEIAARADHLLNDGTFELGAVQARVDALQASLGRNADREWERWGDRYQSYSGWRRRDDFTTPAEEVDYLRAWLVEHDTAMRAIWGL